jgi:hypothetical protein
LKETTSQLVPVEFLRQNFANNKELTRVFLILRDNGLGRAGYTEDHINFLIGKGFAKSTAYRLIKNLVNLNWIEITNKGVKVRSIHKLTEGHNKYCIPVMSSMLLDKQVYKGFIFASLCNSKQQADWKRQQRENKDTQQNNRVSVEVYGSYDSHTSKTTERVMAEYIGISQKSFNLLKKFSCKLGFMKSKFAFNKVNKFGTKEEALFFLGQNPNYKRIKKVGGVYLLVIGQIISISSIISVYKYGTGFFG